MTRNEYRFYDLLIRHRSALIPGIAVTHFQHGWQWAARLTKNYSLLDKKVSWFSH